jgi:prevent-host-death family protein
MKNRVMSATEFKAKCLAVLDQVEKNGETVTVTKRGRPIATVKRAPKAPWKSIEGSWRGMVEIIGDIMSPMTDLWESMGKK